MQGVFLLAILAVPTSSWLPDPEESMTPAELIDYWGYPVEEHDVITEDGYILSMLRIPHGRHSNDTNATCHRPPLLLVHGLFTDASEFLANPPESSPGMILANAGFDVFLLNDRGTTYSQRHINLTSDDPEFWKFSVDDYGKYDAAAAVDKVLELNGAKELYYVGHSQGCDVGFMLLGERPEYNRKVRGVFQLAPAGMIRYSKGLFKWAIERKTPFKILLNLMGPHEFGLRNPSALGAVARFLCPPRPVGLCYDSIQFASGPSTKAFNWSRIPIYLSNAFVSTSTWSILQVLQTTDHWNPSHFDAGPDENLRRYGSIHPPLYNYSVITSDVYLFWSRNDWVNVPREIETWLLPRMRPGVVKTTFEIPEYNHMDFAFATDVADRVFSKIIKIVRKYEPQSCIE